MNISSVRVEGAKRTRKSFLGSVINPILLARPSEEDKSSDLESVLHTTRHLAHMLKKTDLFNSVEASLQRSQDVMSGPEDVDIVFKTRERGRYYLNTSTELGNNEGSAVCISRSYGKQKGS
jgi:outer membrane protein insertion porin family